jgi:hypothetical protein
LSILWTRAVVFESKISIFFRVKTFRSLKFCLFTVTLAFVSATLTAQNSPGTEQPEAPSSLFQTQLGSADFSATAQGTWTEHLGFGWGAGFSSQGTAPLMGYPGYEQGFVFQQLPDFILSLWLNQRYYFQLGYHGSFSSNTFLLGYLGRDNELLRWAKIGNAAISVPSRANLLLSDGQQGEPALAFELGTSFSTHDFLARYEDTTTQTRVFHGSREVNESVINLSSWIRGQFFQIPSTATSYPVSGMTVLIQDPSGSIVIPTPPSGDPEWKPSLQGMSFRVATSAEAYLDPTTGAIRLPATSTKVLLVSWTNAGSFQDPVSHLTYPGISLPGESGVWHVLYLPGSYSPFEVKNNYAVPAGTQPNASFIVTTRDTSNVDYGYTFSWSPGNTFFTVTAADNSLYPGIPFHAATPNPGDLYLPNPSSTPSSATLNLEILVRSYTTQTVTNSINLGTGILPGSISVTRNGQSVPGATYDPQSGTLDLGIPIFDSDEIDVTYQKQNQFQTPTDLRLYQGNHFDLGGGQTLETAESFLWNLQQNRFTTSDGEAPGTIASAVLWQGKKGPWSWSLNTSGAAILADSTGYREIAGLNSGGASANLSSDTVRPSAAPGSIASTYSNTAIPFSATQFNRGAMIYRDYWSTDSLSGAVNLGTGGSPGNENPNAAPLPYGSNGWTGPYLLLGWSTRTDRLLGIESDLGSDQWAGAQVVFNRGLPQDLSSTDAVRLDICLPDTLPPGSKVYFQAGTVGDDIDGTGSVASRTGGTRPGFSFYDQTRNESVDYPLPEGSSWTTDGNNDGVLTRDGALFTRELTLAGDVSGGAGAQGQLSTSTSSWQEVTMELTDAERALLRSANGWRIVVVNPTGTSWSADSRVFVASALFEGSLFSIDATSGNTSASATTSAPPGTTVREIPESAEVSPAPHTLESLYPEVGSRFNPSTSIINVLELLSAGNYALSAYVSPFRYQVWKNIVFYYRFASGNPGTVTLSLTDPNRSGLTVTWSPVSGTDWQKAVVDLQAQTLQVNGVTQGNVVVNGSSANWDQVHLSSTGSSGVIAYFAEIHAENPLWEMTGTVRATGTWNQEQPVNFQGVSVLSATTIQAITQTSGTTAGEPNWMGQTNLSTNLLGSHWNAQAWMAATPGASQLHGAYDASIPLGPLVLTDRFSDFGSRQEGAQLILPYLGSLNASASAIGPPDRLEQNYSASWSRWFSPLWTGTDGLTTTWNLHEIRNIPITLAPFVQQWQDSWSWLGLRSDVPDFTQASAQLVWTRTPAIEGGAVGWNLLMNMGTTQTNGVPWLAGPAASWSLGLPFLVSIFNSPWKFTPSVARSLSLIDQNPSGMLTSQLIQTSWGRLASVSPGWLALPFSELFQNNVFDNQPDTLGTGVLESDAELLLNRPRSLTAWDLALPLQADLKHLNRQSRQDTSLLTYEQTTVSLSSQANNIFGRLGVDPVASWYETDEWSWGSQFTYASGSQVTDNQVLWTANTQAKIFFTSQENVALPVSVSSQWAQTSLFTVELIPSWDIKLPANLPFTFPNWFSPKKFPRQIEHTLSLDLLFGGGTLPAPLLQKLEAVYVATLSLSQASSLAFTMKWGNQWSTFQYVIGLEADLDLKLSF